MVMEFVKWSPMTLVEFFCTIHTEIESNPDGDTDSGDGGVGLVDGGIGDLCTLDTDGDSNPDGGTGNYDDGVDVDKADLNCWSSFNVVVFYIACVSLSI